MFVYMVSSSSVQGQVCYISPAIWGGLVIHRANSSCRNRPTRSGRLNLPFQPKHPVQCMYGACRSLQIGTQRPCRLNLPSQPKHPVQCMCGAGLPFTANWHAKARSVEFDNSYQIKGTFVRGLAKLQKIASIGRTHHMAWNATIINGINNNLNHNPSKTDECPPNI